MPNRDLKSDQETRACADCGSDTDTYWHEVDGEWVCEEVSDCIDRRWTADRADRDRLRAENERYRTAIKTALDTMAVANDAQLGPGGVARKAYAGLWHAYFAIPAGIESPPASDDSLVPKEGTDG